MSMTMNVLEELIEANSHFRANLPEDFNRPCNIPSKLPVKEIAFITCMDTRLVNFLEPALGIERGEAKVIKTAGNSVSGVFDGTIRSLLICIYDLGVKEVFVIGHKGCGMAKASSDSLRSAMLKRGISEDAIIMIEKEMEMWTDEFQHPNQNVKDSVRRIRHNPLIPKDVPIHGLMFDPDSGELDILVNGYNEIEKTDH